MKVFSNEELEEILIKIRDQPIIWDITRKDYKDAKLKQRIYAEIGADYGRTGKSIELCWNALRDKYRREKAKVKKNQPRSGAKGGLIQNTSWPLAKIMRFLDAVPTRRKTYETGI